MAQESSPRTEVSRRRVMAGAAWAAPAIVVASAMQARAASQLDGPGSFVRLTNVVLTNEVTVGEAKYTVSFDYNVYNDVAAFEGTGVQPWQAQEDPSFASWTVNYVLEIVDANDEVKFVRTGSETLLANQVPPFELAGDALVGAGEHTLRVSVTSDQVSTVQGQSFGLNPVAGADGPVLIN